MDRRYQMEFKHDAQTIRRLSQTQYLSFEKRYIVLQMIIGLAFLAFAVLHQDDTALFTLFALFGCWLLISWKQIPLFRANKIVRQCGGIFPTTVYSFGSKGIRVSNEDSSTTVPYTELIRLVEDDEYVFLFVHKEGAYMLKKPDHASAFLNDLTERTGLKWIRPKSLFSLSFKQLRAEKINTKNNGR